MPGMCRSVSSIEKRPLRHRARACTPSPAPSIWSSGVGASVGLEAGYTQLASGIASWIGQAFRLRRGDLRVLVGCGAAGAIAGAFGAPLAGAFYAFELVIASYSVAYLAPVGVAALTGYLVASAFGQPLLGIGGLYVSHVRPIDLATSMLVGVLAAGVGITLMRSVALCETLLREVTGERVSDIIIDQAGQHACDLIVMGTHGRRGLQRLTLGSQAEAVARASPVPVLLVRLQPAAAAGG